MTLSVVITTYCRPEGLRATLESVAAQTRQPDQLVICDNASPDHTPEVAESFRERFPNFIYHRHPENIGMPGNLNAAVGHATGDIVVNLHDADTYDSTLLQKVEAAFASHPSAGLVFWDQAAKHHLRGHLPSFAKGRDFFEHFYLLQYKSFIWGTVGARRTLYDELLPFDPQFGGWADVDMWMRMLRRADIVHLHEPLMHLHDGGEFRAFNFQKPLRIQRMIFLNIFRFYQGEPEKLRTALKGQLRLMRYRWCCHMLSQLRRGKVGLLQQGLRLAPEFFQVPQFPPEVIEQKHLRQSPAFAPEAQ
ncbi:MAG: glycosyltransferase family 2 protein [Opitutales bacterium]